MRRGGWTAGHTGSVVDQTLIQTLVVDLGTNVMARLVDLFVADAPARIGALRDEIVAGRGAPAAGIAHTLKSASSSVGAAAFAARCAQVERFAAGGRLDLAGREADRLPDDLVEARDALGTALAAGSGAG